MSWKKSAFENFRLYAITDIRTPDRSILEKVDSAYRGGADIVQLRSRSVSDRTLYDFGLAMRRLADSHKKLYFVNDRVDIALATGADGVHLGQDDLPAAQAKDIRRKANADFWIGKSTHSLEQAIDAEKEGVDYIGVGPVYGTPTKPDYLPVGLELIAKVKAAIKIPFVAVGGIDQDNINEVQEAGANRIAVVRALFSAGDVYDAAKKLRDKIH